MRTQVRDGIVGAAATAVTVKSWGLPVYAGQMPVTVRIQRACGQRLASGPVPRFGADLLTEIIEIMMTARTIADREAGLARLGPAAGGAQASAAPDARRAGQGGEAPVRISTTASRDTAQDLAMARPAGKIPGDRAHPGHDRALAGGTPKLRARVSKLAKTLR